MKKETAITLISCIFFIFSSLFFINNDFWQDEIYTLTHFVFTPFTTTLFDYHVANNHIAFNFLLNVLRRVGGINEVQEILNHPYYFRILPFTISVLNLLVIYVTSKQLYHKKFALIATSVFATTFTAINFSVQLRGYSLNILVCTLLMYYFLKMIKMQDFQLKNFIALLLLSACSIFVLPTNVYLVIALCVLIMLFFINPSLQNYFLENKFKRRELIKLIVSLLLGVAIATAFYVCLLSIQYSKEMALPVQHFSLKNLVQALAVWYHFVHFNFHFYVLLAVFVFLFFIKREKFLYSNILLLTIVYVLYFIIFFLHGVVII
ncbi:MAG: glycosyltransferase family 39 protein, partial [Chitinophagales bacterium]|nr:glycosyltransferase family 39 protein [Chitinophagales bacterium]